jgi:hypothetical protein
MAIGVRRNVGFGCGDSAGGSVAGRHQFGQCSGTVACEAYDALQSRRLTAHRLDQLDEARAFGGVDREHHSRIGVGEDLADLVAPITRADAGGDHPDARRAEIAEQILRDRRQQQHQAIALAQTRREQRAGEAIGIGIPLRVRIVAPVEVERGDVRMTCRGTAQLGGDGRREFHFQLRDQ